MRILDVMGRRLMVQFSDGLTETRRFFYDGQQVIYEEVSGLTEPYRYVWGNGIDEALLRFGNGDIWYLDNQLGSVMALSDSSGQVIESYSYDVYGAVTACDASGQQISMTNYDNRYLFTGREYNWHTGLYHYRARTYHPVLGRFTSRDPIAIAMDSKYCLGSPVRFTDPKGTQPEPGKCKQKIYKITLRGVHASTIPDAVKRNLTKRYEIVERCAATISELKKMLLDPNGVVYIIEGEYLITPRLLKKIREEERRTGRSFSGWLYEEKDVFPYGPSWSVNCGYKWVTVQNWPISRLLREAVIFPGQLFDVLLQNQRVKKVVIASCYSGGYSLKSDEEKDDVCDLAEGFNSNRMTIFDFSYKSSRKVIVYEDENGRHKINVFQTGHGLFCIIKDRVQVFTWDRKISSGDIERDVYESGWLEKGL